MVDERPTSTRRNQPRDYRDTEPLAVWGLVLTFVFFPVGLVLSYLALRRIRRTGDGGWGIAMVGAILSTIAAACGGVALLGVVLNSGIIEQWRESTQQGRLEGTVNSVVTDIAHAIEEQHEQTAEWATSYKHVEGVEVDDDGEVRDVVVLAYRRGDGVCVDGSRRATVPRTPTAR